MNIEKVGVIGAGTMGAGIATLLAQNNISVILLDIHTPSVDVTLSEFVTVGNVGDSLDKLSDCDWVVEAIIEKLQAKQDLMAQLESTCKADAIISSNTSGIPISDIATERSEAFKRRFLGTHFFNPPTHMKLLEIIPTDDTAPDITNTLSQFGEVTLGKGVVLCKDTPNFIANRIGTVTSAYAMQQALQSGFSVSKIDLLLGELIGRPKTGLLRLGDLIGLDIRVGIMRNLYPNIPDDPFREILRDPDVLAFYDYMIEHKMRGNKDGRGFYNKIVRDDGTREYWTLDLDNYSYNPPVSVDLGNLVAVQTLPTLPQRMKVILSDDSPEADFIRRITFNLLSYAAYIAPEVTYALDDIDKAVRWGFNHQMGPFELWDALGVQETITQMQLHDVLVPDWVQQMVATGREAFYVNGEIYQLPAD